MPERGSDTVKWMVRNRVQFQLNFSVSIIARLEFASVLWKKTAHEQLTIPQTRGILQRSRGYFRDVFHVRDADPIPPFRTGRPLEYKALVKKYHLQPGKNDYDVWHVMCAHNYLRCFGGESHPCLVTCDPELKKIAKDEGYGVIDPCETTPADLEKQYNSELLTLRGQ